MRPTHTHPPPRLGPRPLPSAGAVLLLALSVAGCTPPLVLDRTLPRQVAELGCIGRCQTIKDQCDDDARFDYQQCQAGYRGAQRAFRWCNAESQERCGYPWWSCSENLYGYCSNRYWECYEACRRAPG
jgi:hypothetical protein